MNNFERAYDSTHLKQVIALLEKCKTKEEADQVFKQAEAIKEDAKAKYQNILQIIGYLDDTKKELNEAQRHFIEAKGVYDRMQHLL